MANPSASAEAATSCRATTKLACLCSPTNHPGSFRCSRHRTPRARTLPSSSSVRASQQQAATSLGVTTGSKSGGGGTRTTTTTTSKGGRSITLRVHLQRLVSPPSSCSSAHRRCRDFKPRLSRLGRLASNA